MSINHSDIFSWSEMFKSIKGKELIAKHMKLHRRDKEYLGKFIKF